jgi:hypothetical protein
MQKLANKKVTGKRSVQNWGLYSSILLTCTSFWQITFSRYTFFKLFPWIWNQRKILRFFETHMLKKKKKKFWGHGVHIWVFLHIWVFFGNGRMQIRKKWLNQLKNFFNKHFKEYYLASFCWWIPSSYENQCTLLCSVPDPWHFGMDPDPYIWLTDPSQDPGLFVSDLHDTKKV